MKDYAQCAKCAIPEEKRYCIDPTNPKSPKCACALYADTLAAAKAAYRADPETLAFAHDAAVQEAACYEDAGNGFQIPVKPRILETIEFAKRRGYRKLGLAFCSGLKREAAALCALLEAHGFEVVSAVCKCGAVDKTHIDIDGAEKCCRTGAWETMCNPIGQAMILNGENVDFSLMLGLCVGHDSLFLKNINSMCTVVAAKDRVMGHNPLAALYTLDSYHEYLKK